MTQKNVYLLVLAFAVLSEQAYTQGLILPGAGATNRSMAGASTALPLDAAGAGYWNPASIAGLPGSETFFGAEFVYADTNLASTVRGTFGKDLSDSGLGVMPTIAVVYRPETSTWSYGMAVYTLASGMVNFAGSEFNPITKPFDPPNSFGFGPINATTTVLQMTPTATKKLTEKLSVGGGATVDTMTFTMDPAFFGPRNKNGTFPPATGVRPYWGFGFQAGFFYEQDTWNLGASYKSPQWFETFKYNSKNENGVGQKLELELTLPSILSAGYAYKGFDSFLISADFRYLNYGDTTFFGDPTEDGGLGWESIFALAVGARYQMNDQFNFQGGYLWNQNPIPEVATLFNTQLPVFNRSQLSLGVTFEFSERVSLSGTILYAFRDRVEGPILNLPRTSVEMDQSITTVSFGLAFRP